jgi:methylmalonyl-CoA/ethylmalonyl-CoA epimerase
MTLHHYGFATNDVDKTAAQYELFGFRKLDKEPIIDPIQNVKLLFLQKENSHTIELVQPISLDSPVSNIIQKAGPSLYHICYEVDSIQQSKAELRQNGFIAIGDLTPAIAFKNRLICFLYNKHVGLIELLEK